MRSSTASYTSLLPFLILLIAVPGASAQLEPVRMAPLNEAMEKYDNPPAPPRKMEISPRMISPYAGFISYQVNVDANGNNIVGDAANECTISVDPTNGNKMTIAWRQFNDVTSNFRQGGWGYTTDAGVHWTFPGVLQNNVFRSDPVTQSDETGNFFISVSNPLGQHKRFTVTICGARPMAAKPGRSSRPTEARAAIKHGLRSIRLTDRATGSNTSIR